MTAGDLVSRVKSCLASADFTKDVDACFHLTLLPFCLADAQLKPLPFLTLLFIQTCVFLLT